MAKANKTFTQTLFESYEKAQKRHNAKLARATCAKVRKALKKAASKGSKFSRVCQICTFAKSLLDGDGILDANRVEETAPYLKLVKASFFAESVYLNYFKSGDFVYLDASFNYTPAS